MVNKKCLSCGKQVKKLHPFKCTHGAVFQETRANVCWACLNKIEIIVHDSITDLNGVWEKLKND